MDSSCASVAARSRRVLAMRSSRRNLTARSCVLQVVSGSIDVRQQLAQIGPESVDLSPHGLDVRRAARLRSGTPRLPGRRRSRRPSATARSSAPHHAVPGAADGQSSGRGRESHAMPRHAARRPPSRRVRRTPVPARTRRAAREAGGRRRNESCREETAPDCPARRGHAPACSGSKPDAAYAVETS